MSCERADTLRTHRVPLIRHGAGADLSGAEGFFDFLAVGEQAKVVGEDLKGLGLSTLRGLSKSFKAVDYSGLGGPRSNALGVGEDDGYMPLPSHDAIPA